MSLASVRDAGYSPCSIRPCGREVGAVIGLRDNRHDLLFRVDFRRTVAAPHGPPAASTLRRSRVGSRDGSLVRRREGTAEVSLWVLSIRQIASDAAMPSAGFC